MKIKTILLTALLSLSSTVFWYYKSASNNIACETVFESEKYILGLGFLHIKTATVVVVNTNGTGTTRIRGYVTNDEGKKFKIDRFQEFSHTDASHSGHYNVVVSKDHKKPGDNVSDKILSNFFDTLNDGGEIKEITKLNSNALLINSITKPDAVCLILK